MAVGLGAFPAPAPHTRPVKLAATAPEESSSISAGMGVVAGGDRGARRCLGGARAWLRRCGIPAVGLWARVPHYVTA